MNEFDINMEDYSSMISNNNQSNISGNHRQIPGRMAMMTRPKFNNLIEKDTAQSAESSVMNFNGNISESLVKDKVFSGFNAVVDQVINNPKEETVDNISVDGLVTEEVKNTISVGLDLNKLIKNNNKNNENPENAQMSFDKLVSDFVPNYDNKFGVQPIPINMDRSMLPKPTTKEDLHINNNDKPNGRKISNWFIRMIDQRGENYFTSGKLTTEEVSKNAERIIDDMIAGRVDYDKFGQYIIMPVIIDTLINYCSNKLAINKALQFSLGYTYNDYIERANLIDDPERYNILIRIDDSLIRDITQSIAIVNQDIAIYSILFNRLSYVNATKNASNLYSLINELNSYKTQMKKRY